MYDDYFIYDEPYHNYSYGNSDSYAALGTFIGFFLTILAATWFIVVALAVVKYIGTWKMFKKANVDGWEALIPVHNEVVELQLAGLKTYWFFLYFVPIARLVIPCWKSIELAKAFGKSTGFGVGLWLLNPIFSCILGFGKAQYIGPQTNSNVQSSSNNNYSNSNMNMNYNTNSVNQNTVNTNYNNVAQNMNTPPMQSVSTQSNVQPVQDSVPVQPAPVQQPVQSTPVEQPVQSSEPIQPTPVEPTVQDAPQDTIASDQDNNT